MALINKIRKRAGLAVGIVAVAMGLFIVGTDVFNPNSALLGKNTNTIAEIAGDEIKYEEFQAELNKLRAQFQMRQGSPPSETQMNTLRQQAWEMLIVKHAFEKQYEELGITVTKDESVDMVRGDNINPSLKNDPTFQNPQTGEFDKQRIAQFLTRLRQEPPNSRMRQSWILFEEGLAPARKRLKFDNLLVKSAYATEVEARKQYEEETSVAEVEYLYVPYYTIDQEEITVDEADLRSYYNKHKDEFKSDEASRDISYVTIDIIPTSEDTAYFKEEMSRLQEEFKSTTNDSVFAKSESDTRNYFDNYALSELPTTLQKNHSNLSEGDVRGPYFVDGHYTLYKINDIGKDTVKSARARHILIKWDENSDLSKAEARQKAQSLLNQLRRGADFEELAIEHSEDPGSGRNGGDIGWFGRGKMVEPFEEAVFNATSEGLIPRLVESQFGFHIIDITETPTNASYKVATIQREITPSDATRNESYRKIDLFASSSNNYDQFIENAEENSLEVNTAEDINKNDRRIRDLGDARQIIQWMYKDAEVGDVSQVFEIEDQYIVAVLTGVTPEGVKPFREVEEQVRQKIISKKQGEKIKVQLTDMDGTFKEKASQFGGDANVQSSSDLKLSSSSLPSVGFAPEVIGKVFGMEEGAVSDPIETENGIVVVKVEAISEAPEIADYASYKSQLTQNYSNRSSYNISQVIKDAANIKDYRYRFF